MTLRVSLLWEECLWALHFEARRRAADTYASSDFRDALAWLIDEERRGLHNEVGSLFESDYYLTLTFLPPADKTAKLAGLFIETTQDDGHMAPSQYVGRETLSNFIKHTDAAADMLAAVFPEAAFLSDEEVLT